MAIMKQALAISNFTFSHIPSVTRRDNLLSEPKEPLSNPEDGVSGKVTFPMVLSLFGVERGGIEVIF